jgi:putative DNA primase/helicase
VTDTTNSVYATAVEYANAGLYVFPVRVVRDVHGRKQVRPYGQWRKGSTRSAADIAAWWGPGGECPDHGILIDCGKSGLVVVDPDGEEGVRNWKALFDLDEIPLPLAMAYTPGGGEHWYYRAHPDHVIGNDQDGKVAPHVDVRGLGGFVIAPPTTDGRGSWEWVSDPQWGAPDAVVPGVVIERMKARAPEPPAAGQVADEDAFDDAARLFTEAQATEFIRDARRKLAATTQGFNGAINNFAMACAHFPWLVDRERCARLMIRTLGPVTGWTAPDRQDEQTINSAYSATEAGKSWIAQKVESPTTATSGNEEKPGDPSTPLDVLPPPNRPLDVARELVGQIASTNGSPHRAWWRDDFYRWTGAHWEVEDQPEIERWLYQQTGDAVYLAPAKKEGEPPVRTPWAPTRRKIADVAHALGVGMLQRTGEEDRVLAAANGVVAGRELLEHRPGRFNLFSLPFDYDPAATAPAWQAFMDQVLPDDGESQDFLAEWFGYVLSGRTDQQKMAALIGKKRSGKGTIARVLTALVGKENVSGLNLGLLGGTFGLEPFVGAALAVASDVRWHSRNIGDAVQVLLEVTGEDHVTVHRKNKQAWKGRLGARFMLMSNDTPTFTDRSGALVDRMLYVSFRQSFYGREDAGLTDKLMHELPGILNWALDGLDRLNSRGRFTQPASGMAEAESTRRLADPIGAFIDDWCEIGPECTISLDHLFLKYQHWCEGEGRVRDTTTKEIFSRDLRSKVDGLTVDRLRVEGKRTRILKGITSSEM